MQLSFTKVPSHVQQRSDISSFLTLQHHENNRFLFSGHFPFLYLAFPCLNTFLLLTIEPQTRTQQALPTTTTNIKMSNLSLANYATIRNQIAPMREQELASFRAAFGPLVAYLTNKTLASDYDKSVEDVNNNPQQYSITINEMFSLDTPEMSLVIEWLRGMLSYNVPHGKLNRGLSLVINYRVLAEGYPLSLAIDKSGAHPGGDLYRARITGWCVELLQAYFLVLDDIMDHSVTRRGRPCWYKKVSEFSNVSKLNF